MNQIEIHEKTRSEKSEERLKGLELLINNISDLPDMDQATKDLLALTKDENKDVRWGAVEALGSAFQHITNKDQVWKHLLALTKDEDYNIRRGAAESLTKIQQIEKSNYSNQFFISEKMPIIKFIGREQLLNDIFNSLKSGQNISIIGKRGLGKTFLLNYLCENGTERLGIDFRFIYIDLQSISNEEHFWRVAIKKLGAEGSNPELFLKFTQNSKVIICIDEIEKAINPEKFSLDFWDLLRSYAHESTITLVIASSRPLAEIEPLRETSFLFNIFKVIELKPFSYEESRKLIEMSLERTSVQFTEEEIKDIIKQSGNIPRQLMILGNDLFINKTKSTKSMYKGDYYKTNTIFSSDTASKTDQIWGGVYAQALADFITHEDTEPPLVIGINGKWGAGKSSLMESLRNQIDPKNQQISSESNAVKMTKWDFFKYLQGSKNIENEKKITPEVRFPTVWFNAWKYSREDQLWAALMQSVIKQLTERMGQFDREHFLLKLNMKRIDKDKIRHDIYLNILGSLAPLLIFYLIPFGFILYFRDFHDVI